MLDPITQAERDEAYQTSEQALSDATDALATAILARVCSGRSADNTAALAALLARLVDWFGDVDSAQPLDAARVVALLAATRA